MASCGADRAARIKSINLPFTPGYLLALDVQVFLSPLPSPPPPHPFSRMGSLGMGMRSWVWVDLHAAGH